MINMMTEIGIQMCPPQINESDVYEKEFNKKRRTRRQVYPIFCSCEALSI